MTRNQLKLLAFVEEYRQKHGNGPSYREILAGINVSGVRSVSIIVDALLERGYLISDHNSKFRSLRLTDSGRKAIDKNMVEPEYGKPFSSYRISLPLVFQNSGASVPTNSPNISFKKCDINPGGTAASNAVTNTPVAAVEKTHQPSLFDGTSENHSSLINIQNATVNMPFHSLDLSKIGALNQYRDYAVVVVPFILVRVFHEGFLWFAVLFFSLFLAKILDKYLKE